jgi:hypothetical protein
VERTKRRWLWELNGSWQVETSADGTILYFPHGWGCRYLVPTEEKRCEIEEFLVLWLRRLRAAISASIWFVLPAAAVLVATIVPPFCRVVWGISGWPAILRVALLVAQLGYLLPLGSQLALRFLAATAKADLEKAHVRRPLVESLKDYARRSDWPRLWLEETT